MRIFLKIIPWKINKIWMKKGWNLLWNANWPYFVQDSRLIHVLIGFLFTICMIIQCHIALGSLNYVSDAYTARYEFFELIADLEICVGPAKPSAVNFCCKWHLLTPITAAFFCLITALLMYWCEVTKHVHEFTTCITYEKLLGSPMIYDMVI